LSGGLPVRAAEPAYVEPPATT
ncbi:MAG: hypothetical protein JWR00_2090, partial [Rubritepida sp.]|nr:hypothetical protein [Rubritepida sp.]